MDELTLDGQKYLSSKQAAKVTGYAKDYVGQLCREGRITARLVGRNWYVLESSILEHRFGPEEAEEVKKETQNSPAPAWETNTSYVSEPITMVPELAPKPLPPVQGEHNPQVLADMQAAWKEWFDTQEKMTAPEHSLPDASAMLLEDHEEPSQAMPETEEEAVPVMIHTAPIEEVSRSESIFRPIEPAQELEEEVVPIHIEHTEPRMRPILDMRQENSLEQQVVTRSLGSQRVPYREERTARTPLHTSRARRRRGGAGGLIVQSLFIAIVVIAIAATIIGSGLLEGAGVPSTFITDFLAGQQNISK